MKLNPKLQSLFIGWDVGGWNCDSNPTSRDAIVILDSALKIVGTPWRGNLRKYITNSASTKEWLLALFGRCKTSLPADEYQITMAIDTPLGFPDEFVNLITRKDYVEADEKAGLNKYLFRHTERHIFNQGSHKPLSPVKDMIGSQATKGMHVLAKFAPVLESCGVWSDGAGFRVIETYPTVCRDTSAVKKLMKGKNKLKTDDEEDARTCALIAYFFGTDRGALEGPGEMVPHNEGWIWMPKLNR